MSLEENVAEWVRVDNEYHKCMQQLRTMRERKSGLQDMISGQFSERGLHNPMVRISDGRLALVERKVTQSLTLALVEEALSGCIKDQDTVAQLMDRIKTARSITHQSELRRYYNKKA
jgi:hypothetical protein